MEIPIKKPRGRPRKIPIENPIEIPIEIPIENPIENPIKKPRGRPRKIPLEIDKIPDKEIKKPLINPDKEIKKPLINPDKEIKKPLINPDKEIKKPLINPDKEIKKPLINLDKENDNIRVKVYDKINEILRMEEGLRYVGKDIYIGNIQIVKQIGRKSKNGLIFLGVLDGYKLALKISSFNPKKTNELDTLKIATRAVVDDKTDHFPIMYNYKTYEPMKDYEKFPTIFHKFLKKNYIIYFNELADGDLSDFLNKNYENDELVMNALIQILMSLIDFYKITGKFHNDCHSGNFLYHKIPPTKDFKYEYDGKIIKLKNLGYLFVIWDLEKSAEIQKHKYRYSTDFEKLLMEFSNKDDKFKGFMDVSKPFGKRIKNFVEKLIHSLLRTNIKSLKELISFVYKELI